MRCPIGHASGTIPDPKERRIMPHMDTFLTILITPFYLAWRLFVWILGGLWKFAGDVAHGVYGKLVGYVSAILFVALIGWLIASMHALSGS